jgi:hypothetical protein
LSFETNHSSIKGLKIADPRGVFRGLTYGQWAGVWMNQLFSDKPDINYYGAKGMAFLRGNIQYAYKEDPEHPVFSTMTMESALKIQEDTALFVPVVNTKFVIDNEYQGQVMKDEISMRNTARRDTVSGGDLGVRIREEPDDIDYGLVKDLNDYYVESALFTLSIPETSTFKESMESPIDAGQYFSITAGIFVIISHWPKGKKFRLSVLGKGVGKYLTKSVYDIEVADDASPKLKDISTPPPISTTPTGKPLYDPMGFVANWSDPKATK